MTDLVKRALRARPELAAEILRRGVLSAEERAEYQRSAKPSVKPIRPPHLALGPVMFATVLASGDSQLAARVVLSGRIRLNELRWLDRALHFQRRTDKREELARIVERALEGRKGNVRTAR